MKYKWLLLPLGVVLFIVVSVNFVFNPARWDKLSADKTQVEEQQAQIAALRQKLAVLTAVDPTAEGDNLKYLNTAMPTTKMIWYVVSQMKNAASESGTIIEEYKAVVGSGLAEATEGAKVVSVKDEPLKIKALLTVRDPKDLVPFVQNLENRLPLVRVDAVDYVAGKATIELVSAWAPITRVQPQAQGLPDYKQKVNQAKLGIAGFVSFSDIVVPAGTPEIIVNPF